MWVSWVHVALEYPNPIQDLFVRPEELIVSVDSPLAVKDFSALQPLNT